MIALREMDAVLQAAQRQGRIPFYATAEGEEGAVVGAAAALTSDDFIWSQYREHGILLYRGYPLQNFVDQCCANEDDECGKGRQMPVHWGSAALSFMAVSSTLTSQIPHTAGAALAFKLDARKHGKSRACRWPRCRRRRQLRPRPAPPRAARRPLTPNSEQAATLSGCRSDGSARAPPRKETRTLA